MNSIQALSSLLQWLPLFKGKRRLGRLIMRISGASEKANFVLKTKTCALLVPNFKDSISTDLFINGFYEIGLVKMLVKSIPLNGVLIDVGANIGSICIPVSRMRRDVKIIAVEASPWIFELLKKNVESNNATNVTALNYAVYNESRKTLPMFAPKDLFGKGSLKSVFTKDAEMVETITLDDVKRKCALARVDFIKVDVEGFEASVFSGMSEFTVSDKPKIVFEYADWSESLAGFRQYEAQSIILSKGYKIQLMDDEFSLIGEPSGSIHEVKSANMFAF